jgi:hypothetical protein
MTFSSTSLIFIVLVPLIVWRMYARIRRLIGRQRSKPVRHWLAAIFFPLLILLLAATALAAPMALAALVAGVVVGVALAWWGLRLTQFEKTGEGYFYTPNAHIGIALSVLLVARLGYRFFQMATLVGPDAARATHEFGRSPLTMVIIGMLAAYYASYAVGILRWRASAAQ